MKFYSVPLSKVFLLLPGIVLVLSFLVSAVPGSLFAVYLVVFAVRMFLNRVGALDRQRNAPVFWGRKLRGT